MNDEVPAHAGRRRSPSSQADSNNELRRPRQSALVSITGVARLFVGKPVHPVGDDGRMALSDHLRELRARHPQVGPDHPGRPGVVSLFFFEQLYDVVYWPINQAQDALPEGPTS